MDSEWSFKGLPPDGVAVLALGGNLGDVEAAFRAALSSLGERGLELLRASSLYRTKAVGCEPGAPDFLNAVVLGRWKDSPQSLLAVCKELEGRAGRPSEHPHWHSRALDIDIIAFGSCEVSGASLNVPHPLALERLFVVEPFAEIAPEARIPGCGVELAEALRRLLLQSGGVRSVAMPFRIQLTAKASEG